MTSLGKNPHYFIQIVLCVYYTESYNALVILPSLSITQCFLSNKCFLPLKLTFMTWIVGAVVVKNTCRAGRAPGRLAV